MCAGHGKNAKAGGTYMARKVVLVADDDRISRLIVKKNI